MSNYVYIKSEPGIYTVGFFDPEGKWHAETDHDSHEEAAKRVHFLNGGEPERIERSYPCIGGTSLA